MAQVPRSALARARARGGPTVSFGGGRIRVSESLVYKGKVYRSSGQAAAARQADVEAEAEAQRQAEAARQAAAKIQQEEQARLDKEKAQKEKEEFISKIKRIDGDVYVPRLVPSVPVTIEEVKDRIGFRGKVIIEREEIPRGPARIEPAAKPVTKFTPQKYIEGVIQREIGQTERETQQEARITSLTVPTRFGLLRLEPVESKPSLPKVIDVYKPFTVRERVSKQWLSIKKGERDISKRILTPISEKYSKFASDLPFISGRGGGVPSFRDPTKKILAEFSADRLEEFSKAPIKEAAIGGVEYVTFGVIGAGIKGGSRILRAAPLPSKAKKGIRGIATGLGLGVTGVALGTQALDVYYSPDPFKEAGRGGTEFLIAGAGIKKGAAIVTKKFPIEKAISQPTAEVFGKLSTKDKSLQLVTKVKVDEKRATEYSYAKLTEDIPPIKEVSLGVRDISIGQREFRGYTAKGIAEQFGAGKISTRLDTKLAKGYLEGEGIYGVSVGQERFILKETKIGLGKISKRIPSDKPKVITRGGGVALQQGEEIFIKASGKVPIKKYAFEGKELKLSKLKYEKPEIDIKLGIDRFPIGAAERLGMPKIKYRDIPKGLIKRRKAETPKELLKRITGLGIGPSTKAQVGLTRPKVDKALEFLMPSLKITRGLKQMMESQTLPLSLQKKASQKAISLSAAALERQVPLLKAQIVSEYRKPPKVLIARRRLKPDVITTPRLSAQLKGRIKEKAIPTFFSRQAPRISPRIREETGVRSIITPRLKIGQQIKVKQKLLTGLSPRFRARARIKPKPIILEKIDIPSFDLKPIKIPKLKKKKRKARDDYGISETFVQRQLLLPIAKPLRIRGVKI